MEMPAAVVANRSLGYGAEKNQNPSPLENREQWEALLFPYAGPFLQLRAKQFVPLENGV
jgi:hypothetical protein